MKKFLSMMVCAALLLPLAATAQQTFEFDLTASQPAYSDATGYGYDLGTGALSKKDLHPTFFSVKVPDGNYKVTVTVGSKSYAGVTVLRAETRRLFEEKVVTRKGEFKTFTFNVHVHSTEIDGNTRVGISMRERVDVGWDNKLTLEFNGDAPAVKSIRIEPADDDVVTVWLCGDSTVVDQDADPYTSWGQILPRFFTEKVVVANLANSGLTTTSFYNQNRLAKILHSLKPGDYVVVEFGHNDEKDRGAGSGAWYRRNPPEGRHPHPGFANRAPQFRGRRHQPDARRLSGGHEGDGRPRESGLLRFDIHDQGAVRDVRRGRQQVPAGALSGRHVSQPACRTGRQYAFQPVRGL